jgi:DNA repair exonuclease SbcCD ATPase subunit
LILALGLVDVVQAYAGGIHLETIFVDEGFGGLDPEALDLAFRALVDLQRGGRLVGIISHVPELKSASMCVWKSPVLIVGVSRISLSHNMAAGFASIETYGAGHSQATGH